MDGAGGSWRNTDREGFSVLSEALESARKRYAESGLEFGYAFNQPLRATGVPCDNEPSKSTDMG